MSVNPRESNGNTQPELPCVLKQVLAVWRRGQPHTEQLPCVLKQVLAVWRRQQPHTERNNNNNNNNNNDNNNNNIIIIIINLIYIDQFDTDGILTALYIVITYIQMQYVHV